MSLRNKYKHDPKLATVIVTDQSGTLIKMPNGDILPGIIMTRVTDHIDDRPYVLVKMNVNLGFTDLIEDKNETKI